MDFRQRLPAVSRAPSETIGRRMADIRAGMHMQKAVPGAKTYPKTFA
jgi:hypothetical protein